MTAVSTQGLLTDSMKTFTAHVNNSVTDLVRDSGSSCSGVAKHLVSDSNYTGRSVRCVNFDGSVSVFKTAIVELDCPFFCGNIEAAVIEKPLFGFILGNHPQNKDDCSLKDVVKEEKAQNPKSNTSGTRDVKLNDVDLALSCAETNTTNNTNPISFDNDKDDLSTLQRKDPSLKPWFRKVGTKPVKRVSFRLIDNRLYRIYHSPKGEICSLVVPACYRAKALRWAHDSAFDGHGFSSILRQMRKFFSWPGLMHDIKKYVKSGD